MNDKRFVLYSGGSAFAVSDSAIWPDLKRPPALRLGLRCCIFEKSGYRGLRPLPASPSTLAIDGLDVHVNIAEQIIPADSKYDNASRLITADLWTSAPRATSDVMRSAIEALDHARKLTEEVLNDTVNPSLRWSLNPQQAHADIRLPRDLAARIGLEQIRSEIMSAGRLSGSDGDRLPTLRVERRQLRFGPEKPEAVGGLQKLFARETAITLQTARLTAHDYAYLRLMPLAAALILLGGWLCPLDWPPVAGATILLLLCLAISLEPARQFGFRLVLRRSSTIATIGFTGIGLFGIAYAACALLDPNSIGENAAFSGDFAHGASLGYAFLVSTSLGIAGGVFGDAPSGIARIIAHIQLLLFTGGVASLIATLLRIRSNTEPRER